MIIFYSGTGNSAHCARYLGELLKDEIVDLTPRIREGDFRPLRADRLIVVTPIYCWRLPEIVTDYLHPIELSADRIVFVATCGDGAGAASAYARRWAQEKGIPFGGFYSVVMPENYTALFSAPPIEEARAIVRRADARLSSIADSIQRGEIEETQIGLGDRLRSKIAPFFYTFVVSARAFRVKDNCIGCGACARLCVCGNIEMAENRPRWHDRCTHCMACINRCPVEAIEYGRRTAGKFRYTYEKIREEDGDA